MAWNDRHNFRACPISRAPVAREAVTALRTASSNLLSRPLRRLSVPIPKVPARLRQRAAARVPACMRHRSQDAAEVFPLLTLQRAHRIQGEILAELFVRAHFRKNCLHLRTPEGAPSLRALCARVGILTSFPAFPNRVSGRLHVPNAFLSVINAARILVLIVPSGSPVFAAISEWLSPSKYAISIALRCAAGMLPITPRIFSAAR